MYAPGTAAAVTVVDDDVFVVATFTAAVVVLVIFGNIPLVLVTPQVVSANYIWR